jgi:glycerophosphoryl diester phosphodiesterase
MLARAAHRHSSLPGPPSASFYGACKPLVLAHRGARTEAPENTLEAFARAVEQGAHGVELDVMLTRDRTVAVFHDQTLGRLGHPHLAVADVEYTFLRSLDVGHLVKDGPPWTGVWIPTLEDALHSLPAPNVINVELKGAATRPDGMEVAVLRAVARAGAEKRVIYSSFNPLRLLRLRRLAPDVTVGMLHDEDQPAHLRDLWWLPAVAPHALHPSLNMCTHDYVMHARRLGLAIHVWTVNRPADVRRMAAMGVDAIITDVPAVALQTLG